MIIKEEIKFLEESNAIEGVYSSEMLGQAIEAWEYLKKSDTMNPQLVRKVHKILMATSNLEKNQIGYYRTIPVYIGKNEAMKHTEIAESIREWCKSINDDDRSFMNKEQLAQWLHVEYERIHPFVDGNGRTGRMFMNWHRIKKLNLPLLTIHTGAEQQEYYKWFQTKEN